MTLSRRCPTAPRLRGPIRRRRLHRVTFVAAGVYNLVWAAYSILDPQWLMRVADMPPSNYPQLFACLAMVVGVYGFIYLEVARVPERGFVLAGVGLVGKIAGPIGMAYLVVTEQWEPGAFWLCVTNDLIWWAPFALYLRDAWPYFRDDLQGADTPLPPVTTGPRAGTAVYTRLLGPDLDRLPPAVRDLHAQRAVEARGHFEIHRESGLLPWLACVFSPLPATGSRVALDLEVSTVGPYQIWSRSFDGRPMVSAQHARADGRVAERFGPIEVRLTLALDGGVLAYESVGAALCLGPIRVPLPRALCPRISARVSAGEGPGVAHTVVTVSAPSGARLMWYGGPARLTLRPEPIADRDHPGGRGEA